MQLAASNAMAHHAVKRAAVPCLSLCASTPSLLLRTFTSSAAVCAPSSGDSALRQRENRVYRKFHYVQGEKSATFQANRRATDAEIAAGRATAGEIPVAPIEAAIEAEASAEAGEVSDEKSLSVPEGSVVYSGRSATPLVHVPDHFFRTKSMKDEGFAKKLDLAIAPQKLNDICRTVRGLGVQEALIQLKLSQKKKAGLVRDVITTAMSTAVGTHGLDKSRLYVDRLWIGHGTHLKRLDIKGRGRSGIKKRYRTHVYCIVREQGRDDAKFRGLWDYGGNSHNIRTGEEVRIGRAGRTFSTVERTLEQMKEWRVAQGLSPQIIRSQVKRDAKKAFRAAGIATDHEAIFGQAAVEAAKAEAEAAKAAKEAAQQ